MTRFFAHRTLLRGTAMSGLLALAIAVSACGKPAAPEAPPVAFQLEEATIAQIQQAILARRLTTAQLVRQYLARIKAYNGTCVEQPQGILGPVAPIAGAGQINALSTLNLRPAARKELGFDDRKARSMTDTADDDPSAPDALEIAAQLDRQFAQTGKLAGPLHGVVMAIKDQYDTFDMRTTAGADAFYANDRPPDDATFVKRLRAAGAIVLAKSNLGEYASPMGRSSFGGTFCNPYDTRRYPGGSSGGSGSSVGANLVTCAIAEETGASIRTPARHNSSVGIAPTQELVSRDGMIGAGLNTRTGPICRTVEDAARVLDVIAGYDPKDELTVFSIGRTPDEPYQSFARERSLQGFTIGVVREYMDKSLFTKADEESIDIVDRAIADLKKLGATVVDPGPGGALFQQCLDKYNPYLNSAAYIEKFPGMFAVDAKGAPSKDHIAVLVDLAFDPKQVPAAFSLRDLGSAGAAGEGRYLLDRYLRERGDANIKRVADLATQANFFDQPDFAGSAGRRKSLENQAGQMTMNTAERLQKRFAIQQMVLQCMQEMNLDALTYPTGNVPTPILGAPYEPNVNSRNGGSSWNLLGQQGFPTITVPAGFTTHVYDRVRDPASPDGTRLVGPTAAKLPVGIDFLGRPFAEPVLLRIASAYEAATKHRVPPAAFGPLPKEP
jgi:Asp-tRNA(Asn)/Glu-tRNA(Gln) amidotransferase A subunit family amidase